MCIYPPKADKIDADRKWPLIGALPDIIWHDHIVIVQRNRHVLAIANDLGGKIEREELEGLGLNLYTAAKEGVIGQHT
jgi:3D (Asp-Asp-Asp) domain-containing protein